MKDVSAGDQIVVSKQLVPGRSTEFDFEKSRKGDYKVNRINEVNIPTQSTPELLKYLGLYVGDGWTRINRAEVGFALPENTKGRQALLGLHKALNPKSPLVEGDPSKAPVKEKSIIEEMYE